jgi:cyclophilin family peptidyl-prolyl cis-trans isomerase/protein-disulfide isomerase
MDDQFRGVTASGGAVMKRSLVILFLSVTTIFILSACASSDAGVSPTLPIIPVLPTPTFDRQSYADSCSVIVAEPTLAPNSESYFPPVSPADFTFGPADAPVTIVEYCDFQSNSCRSMSAVIAKLMKNHSNVRFVFRPFPLIGLMDKSDKAIVAALAADAQEKFWTMYDFLFVTYPTWDKLKPEEFNAWVIKESAQTGIDPLQLEAAINDPKTTTRMMSIYESVKKLNIPAVPIVLVNGTLQPSYVLDYQSMSGMTDLIALGQKQFTQCPPFDIDPLKQYIATIHTDKGNIVMQLFPDKAPLAVNSFVFLARQKWFDGVTFHSVIPGFIAQAGDPSGTGRGNPGYFFNNEMSDLKFDKPGMVAMANSGADTNGSQFFITFAPASHLDGGYTIFGQVLTGLDVAENLTPRDASQGSVLPEGDRIISVNIEEK